MPGFQSKLVDAAKLELATYGKLKETASPLKERVGAYWTALGRPDLDGSDQDVPWSAAFISFMVRSAGAGPAFPYSAQHSVYIYRTINDLIIKKKTSFWGFEPTATVIQPGDIVGMNRGDGPTITYDFARHHADYKSHCDVVTAVEATKITTIGGNVSNSVAAKQFVQKNGTWVNSKVPAQTIFVVIRSFLP